MTPLTPADLELHHALGIDPDLLTRLQVQRVTDRDVRDLLALNGRTGQLGGILYPYLLPGTDRPVTHRVRRDAPELEAGKPKDKYLSAFGDHRHLYFTDPDPAWLPDATIPVIISEAEKSALAIMSAAQRLHRRVVALALGGCWNWRGRIGKATTATGAHVDEVGPLPDFDRLTWTGRDVVLAFDANAATNQSVQAARRHLALELAKRGALVRILTLPEDESVNGPDDAIGHYGDAAFFARVETAADAATHDVIFRLNRKHAVVRETGKTVVLTEERDPVLKRDIITRSTFTDFRNFYLHESVPIGTDRETGRPIFRPLGHVWLSHKDRRQYDGVIMAPNADQPGFLNLWRGFAVTPKPGDWSRFRQHVYEVICASNTALFDYVLLWLAQGVQSPDRQAEVALVLRGDKGAGKGLFARTYGDLFGQHYMHISNTHHLTGHFNAHLQDTIALFVDEAFWAGDKQGEGVLKMLVTEPVIAIERKGRDVVLAKNLLHLIIASNNEWVVPAGIDERRFCVMDVDPGYKGDHPYFAALMRELNDGGREALLYDLLHMDLTMRNVRQVPQTEALRHQKVLSLSPNERWLFDKFMSGQWLPTHDGWRESVPKDALHEDYIRLLQKVGVDRRGTETELGMFINKVLPTVRTRRLAVDGRRQWCWIFPPLADCRAAFDHYTSSAHPWGSEDE